MSPSATEAFFASRAMQALEVLAFGPSTATRVADELQVHPRTARRLLNRMVHDGWLIRRDGPRPTYTPTLRIVALAAQLAQRAPLVRHGLEVTSELHADTGWDVHLAVPSYRSALRLVRATGAEDAVPALRDLAPAHAIAAGKLLLAFREPWRDAVLAAPLTAVTARTVTDPLALRAELERARRHGFAVENAEFRAGVRAVAVPVIGEGGEVVAALAVSAGEVELEVLVERREPLSAAAAALGTRLDGAAT
ncbi:helix-turn-helix domain-containing protein [Solirubrobacter phytolaccae]|uniref:Helix-turn-helix domain-containing protein n=1 Tax=Solirubrobacter phytolaccae TaxID=1404360 RepID=A0A9X3SC89_9ACTN|nr:IclR family transcriptional regulator C-terminal domain-containing protein [Solirubrobacter phytolaccae]MDA0184356.1 helix-turn-helix domain-containing protein [Solirubrobacter phytolaccae]